MTTLTSEVISLTTNKPEFRIVATDDGVSYQTLDGKPLKSFSPNRAARIARIAGKELKTARDWLQAASQNIGYYSVQEPVES